METKREKKGADPEMKGKDTNGIDHIVGDDCPQSRGRKGCLRDQFKAMREGHFL